MLRHPAQVVVVAFAAAVLVGTLLLMLPLARAGTGTGAAPFATALYTSTSAVCVTGLAVVDTATYWSTSGQWIILGLVQVGGFGIMTLGFLLGLLVFRRLGLRSRLTAAAEAKASGIGEVRTVVRGVFTISLLFETVTALALTLRFAYGYDQPWTHALRLGVFHAVSAFNNAGFALFHDSLMRFATDPWICLPIAFAVIAGGLGFPVWIEVYRHLRAPRMWSLHTKMTLTVTAALFVLGTVFVTVNEWSNPHTLGTLDEPGRVLAGFFQSVMPRSGGFNTIDYGHANDGTLLGTEILMFIGGGSAGAAGGIKVTTFILLFFVIWAEVRGDNDVEAFGRRLDPRAIRQALTVALLSVGAIVTASLVLLEITQLAIEQVLFEVISAFATVGLSTGITPDLPTSADMILVALMFVGRLGPITLVSALALRERPPTHRLAEGRPLIG